MEHFEPEPRAKAITLRLVMDSSLTKEELAEYNALGAEEALERARALKTVHLEWNNITEISNLEPFEAAEVLYLQHNRIERIEGLDCLPGLQFLALQGNRIAVMENLLCLRELEFLELSKNLIEELREDQLPQTVNILSLRDNPCALTPAYQNRILARLPDLIRLDGKDLVTPPPAAGSNGWGGALSLGLAPPESLVATEQGLGAYWRKGEMQSSVEASIKERIQAYSMEALSDVDGFERHIEDATARSKARRLGLGSSGRFGGTLNGTSGFLGGSLLATPSAAGRPWSRGAAP